MQVDSDLSVRSLKAAVAEPLVKLQSDRGLSTQNGEYSIVLTKNTSSWPSEHVQTSIIEAWCADNVHSHWVSLIHLLSLCVCHQKTSMQGNSLFTDAWCRGFKLDATVEFFVLGELNEEVWQEMNTPSCAYNDAPAGARKKRYSKLSNRKWEDMPLTISFGNFAREFTRQKQLDVALECARVSDAKDNLPAHDRVDQPVNGLIPHLRDYKMMIGVISLQ